jgi:hypothetical protein
MNHWLNQRIRIKGYDGVGHDVSDGQRCTRTRIVRTRGKWKKMDFVFALHPFHYFVIRGSHETKTPRRTNRPSASVRNDAPDGLRLEERQATHE